MNRPAFLKRASITVFALLMMLLSACAFGKLETTELSEQFAETSEHNINRHPKASEAPEVNPDAGDGEDTLPGETAGGEDSGEGQEITPAEPSATPTPTLSPTPSPSPTPTLSPTPTATPSPSPTPLLGTYAKNGKYEEVPEFTGTSYIIIDAADGETLLAKDSGKQIYPASTIKILTALTALDYKDMVNEITAKQEVLDTVPWDASQYGVVADMTYPLEVWMNMLLVSSCGDAANIIAEGCAGSVDMFIRYMNDKAEELGMTATHVDNAIGLDIGNDFYEMYSTAEDIAKLSRVAMKNYAIANIVARKEYQVPDSPLMAGKLIESTNYYLSKSDRYYSEHFSAIGTKSGRTDAAGVCQVITAVSEDGRKYICCYFGGSTREKMFDEITALLDYCFINFD